MDSSSPALVDLFFYLFFLPLSLILTFFCSVVSAVEVKEVNKVKYLVVTRESMEPSFLLTLFFFFCF